MRKKLVSQETEAKVSQETEVNKTRKNYRITSKRSRRCDYEVQLKAESKRVKSLPAEQKQYERNLKTRGA
jgi:hypothetical protein